MSQRIFKQKSSSGSILYEFCFVYDSVQLKTNKRKYPHLCLDTQAWNSHILYAHFCGGCCARCYLIESLAAFLPHMAYSFPYSRRVDPTSVVILFKWFSDSSWYLHPGHSHGCRGKARWVMKWHNNEDPISFGSRQESRRDGMAAHHLYALRGLPAECLRPVHFHSPRRTAGGHKLAGRAGPTGDSSASAPAARAAQEDGWGAGVLSALFPNRCFQSAKRNWGLNCSSQVGTISHLRSPLALLIGN